MNTKSFSPRGILLTAMILVLILLVCIAAFFSLRNTFERFSLDFYYPVFKTVRMAEHVVVDQALLAREKNELVAAVDQLSRQNAELTAANAALNQTAAENKQLRVIAGLQPPPSYRAVYAEVLLRDPVTWNQVFTVDSGSNAGITEGDLVVAPVLHPDGRRYVAGVVGRVQRAAKHTATVVTILNSDCMLGVIFGNSLAPGNLCGTDPAGKNTVCVTHLPKNTSFTPGELVVTSGFSEGIPGGIMVGTLAADSSAVPVLRHTELFTEARIKPAVSFDSLVFVTVLSRTDKE